MNLVVALREEATKQEAACFGHPRAALMREAADVLERLHALASEKRAPEPILDHGAYQVEMPADEEYQALLGTLAALDVVLVSHDQPVIAAEIVRAAGPKQVMRAAIRSGYPFMPALRKLYKNEGFDK